jgi:hypothetical protein
MRPLPSWLYLRIVAHNGVFIEPASAPRNGVNDCGKATMGYDLGP